MAEPRYQVFVSSTYTDLIEERQAVIEALLQLGAMPAGMELFPAANEEAWALIQRVIDESDYYLLIIGGRYGSVTEEGLSFTEKEFDYAEGQSKPVMAFLHGQPGKIVAEKTELDPAAREKLLAFRRRVETKKHVKYWTSEEDLAGKIALSFSSFIRTYPAVGWIRADSGDSPATLRRLTQAQERILELEARLGSQGAQPPPGVEGLASDDEQVRLAVTLTVLIKNVDVLMSKVSTRQTLKTATYISWNEALFELGPSLLNEATQSVVEKRLLQGVRTLRGRDFFREAHEWLDPQVPATDIDGYQAGKKKPRLKLGITSEITHADFETVLLQLEALGLIARSDRKRPIADRNTYWTLTPWGRTRLKQLRAVPKGSDRSPDPSGMPASEPESDASEPE